MAGISVTVSLGGAQPVQETAQISAADTQRLLAYMRAKYNKHQSGAACKKWIEDAVGRLLAETRDWEAGQAARQAWAAVPSIPVNYT